MADETATPAADGAPEEPERAPQQAEAAAPASAASASPAPTAAAAPSAETTDSGDADDATGDGSRADGGGDSKAGEDGASADAAERRLSAVKRIARDRRAIAGVAALLCVIAGVVGSLLATRPLVREDEGKARERFDASAAEIASKLNLAAQREEDLTIAASTFFASNSKSSPTQLNAWTTWAHVLRRYPELQRLALVPLVHSSQLSAFAAQVGAHRPQRGTTAAAVAESFGAAVSVVRTAAAAAESSGATDAGALTQSSQTTTAAGEPPTTTSGATAPIATAEPPVPVTVVPATESSASAGESSSAGASSSAAASSAASALAAAKAALNIVPAGDRPFYCLTAGEVVKGRAPHVPTGLDYCARGQSLLAARDSGHAIVKPLARRRGALEVWTPVYRGVATPPSRAARIGAFVGWLREVLRPGVLAQQALAGHPGYALRLRYGRGVAAIAAAGSPPAEAQTAASRLRNGWSVQSFGPAATLTLLSDGHAAWALAAGVLLSLLIGLAILSFGAVRRGPVEPAPRVQSAAPSPPQTTEVLYDPLTGVPARALTLDRAGRMLARAGRQSGVLAGALLIDIDWFKDVNEKLGRQAGDQLLQIVAQRLENAMRAQDTVGRLGDDKFLVLVETSASGVRPDALAQRVIEALHRPIELQSFGPSFFMTASIGVAFGRYEAAEDLLRDAELALKSAKAAGKDRYTLFNASMRSVIEGRGVLEAELNAALQDGQLFLLYQPIWDMGTRYVAAVEALLRWRHPKRGVLGPEEFVPLAEESGLIVPIGRWALEEACNRAAAWEVAGERIGVCVKVSDKQLNREGFVTDVRRALQQSGLQPSRLTLEISETAVMHDVTLAGERLAEIKQLGVKVSIDDFGASGYAYHSDLRRLPLDSLRVDRGSLAASDDEAYRNWLLEAILIVGRELSLAVVAKGVDSQEQAGALRAMGCTMAQGLFMGEPVSAEGVANLFRAELPIIPTPPTPMPTQSMATSMPPAGVAAQTMGAPIQPGAMPTQPLSSPPRDPLA